MTNPKIGTQIMNAGPSSGPLIGFVEKLTIVQNQTTKPPMEVLREHAAHSTVETRENLIALDRELRAPTPDQNRISGVLATIRESFALVPVCVQAADSIAAMVKSWFTGQ